MNAMYCIALGNFMFAAIGFVTGDLLYFIITGHSVITDIFK